MSVLISRCILLSLGCLVGQSAINHSRRLTFPLWETPFLSCGRPTLSLCPSSFLALVEALAERPLFREVVVGSIGSFQIGAAARASGVSVKMARHYEATGLLPPAERGPNGARLFSQADVHTLRFIGHARSLGFSLCAIRKLLSLWQDPMRSNADTLQLAEQQMDELIDKAVALDSMTTALQQLIDACAGDGRPDCPILDDLARERPISRRLTDRAT